MGDAPDIRPVVLAAGLSSRWGAGDKLIAHTGKETVLGAVLNTATQLGTGTPLVVCRTDDQHHIAEAAGCEAMVNPHPEGGISTSLRLAVKAVRKDPQYQWMLILLGDMPFLKPASLRAMLALRSPALDAVAARYPKPGPPVLFQRHCFDALLTLDGDTGAAQLLRSGQLTVALHEFSPDEMRDIDRPSDLFATAP